MLTACLFRPSALYQRPDLAHELRHVFEIEIHRGEPYVSYLIKFFEPAHDEFSDLLGGTLALVLEQSPEGATPRDLRKQCEQFGKQLHYHAKLMRAAFEQTGQHPIEDVLGDFASPIAKTAH